MGRRRRHSQPPTNDLMNVTFDSVSMFDVARWQRPSSFCGIPSRIILLEQHCQPAGAKPCRTDAFVLMNGTRKNAMGNHSELVLDAGHFRPLFLNGHCVEDGIAVS